MTFDTKFEQLVLRSLAAIIKDQAKIKHGLQIASSSTWEPLLDEIDEYLNIGERDETHG